MKYILLLLLINIQINAMEKKYGYQLIPKSSLLRFNHEYSSVMAEANKNTDALKNNAFLFIEEILEHSRKNKKININDFTYTRQQGILPVGINRNYDKIMGEEGYSIIKIKEAIATILNQNIDNYQVQQEWKIFFKTIIDLVVNS